MNSVLLLLMGLLPSMTFSSLWNEGGFVIPSNFDIRAASAYDDWATSAETFKMPQGCRCIETDKSKRESDCTIFTCGCLCDLNAGQCDLNCCCDQECTDIERESFTTCDDDNDGEGDIIETCASRDVLATINPKYPLQTGDASSAAVSSLLCVHEYNTEMKGEFFAQDLSSLTKYTTKTNNYAKSNALPSEDKNNGKYQRGDFLEGILSANKHAFSGYLSLPVKSPGGICEEMNAIKFGVDVDQSSCLRKIPSDLSTVCGTNLQYDYGRFTDMKITGPTSNVSMTVDLTGTIVGDGKIAMSGTDCNNAMKSIAYEFEYSVEETTIGSKTEASYVISAVNVLVELATIVAGSGNYLRNTHSVSFLPDYTPQETDNRNALVNRTRSGNPGYISGRPVLSGVPNSDTPLAVNASTAGLSTFASFDGSCSNVDEFGTVIGFGEDTVVGCVREMSESELAAFCDESSELLTKVGTTDLFIPWWLKFNGNMVGKFGNADPLDATQWIGGVTASTAEVSKPVLSDNGFKCKNIPNRINLDLQWSYVGSVKNPQARIMKAEVSYDFDGPMVFKKGPGSGDKDDFTFMATVTWSYHEESSSIYDPPAPPIIFSVPYDVFYPFAIEE